MSKYEAVFKRYEKKYLLTKTQYEELSKRLQGKIVVDDYGVTSIHNIYFDTPEYQLIRTSLAKPKYKEKLRLRSYHTPTSKDNVFIELKKKYDGIVYKRRMDMKLEDAVNYLYYPNKQERKQKEGAQIKKEIDWVLHYYKDIMPAMYIGYERVACYGVEDHELRITYDKNIVWRTTQLDLTKGMWGSPLLDDGEVVMEIKIKGAIPLWLSRILDECNIYPTSFSKYGRGYEELIWLKRKETYYGESIIS